nr:MAG TPA: hypothetical protein [Caudoviricetes sp.]
MTRSKRSITFRDMYKSLPIELDYFTYTRILEEMCNVIL